MTVCYELPDSRSYAGGDSPRWTLRYRVEGTTDCFTARWQVLSTAPLLFENLVRQSPSIEPEDDVAGIWSATVDYAPRQKQEGDVEFQFEIGGGSARVTQSLQTMGSYAASGTPPNFGGAIGVTRSGNDLNIEGVDVPTPEFAFSLRCRLPPSVFTQSYYQQVYAVKAAPINSGAFFGFAAGEVRFDGASGSYKQGEDYGEITYKFSASPNRTGLSVGDITGIAKGGWDYLWVLYEETVDGAAAASVKRPAAAYVERVMASSNFGLLGLG